MGTGDGDQIAPNSSAAGTSLVSRDTGQDWNASELLAAIVQSSQDAIIGKSLTGTILSWNPGAERLYGWSAQQAIGQHVDLLVPEDQRELEQQLFSRILAGEQLEAFELRRLHRDGSQLEVSLSMSPVLDRSGQIVGVSSSSRDVSDLQRARRRFQRILDAAPDAVVCVEATGEITFVNAAVETLFHYRPEELIGQPVEVLLAEAQRATHVKVRTQYRIDPTPRTMGDGAQLYGRRRDGSTFPADISLAPVDDSGTGLTVAAVRDATARYAIEASIRESEQRFRQVTESIEVGFTLRSLSTDEFLYVSPGYLHILGLDQKPIDKLSPSMLGELVHSDDRGERVSEYLRLVETGRPAQLELRIVRADGVERWVRATSTPVPDEDGSVDRVAGTLEDITERKTAEAAARSARREAERANSAKSEFLSRMSHELRTPLNAVLGFAQLLELDQLSEAQQNAVQHILRGGRHLLEMINDVLDISRIETDQLEISIESVLVSELLLDTVGLMRPLATKAAIEIRCDLDQPAMALHVQADRRRLRQVLLNLLSNAIKYNKRAGLVELTCEVSADDQLRLAVTDTGIGVRPEHLPRLFVPFDRLGEAVADIEGTGIGLALSQRLVAVMGGNLEVQSELGVGSTFTVVLPLMRPASITLESNLQVDAAVTRVPDSTLLYVEDNLSNVQLLERILERRPGWKLVHAGNGALGAQLAAASHPALILLDMHLPDGSGLDVLRGLRAAPETADIPVVIVSADASPQQVARAEAAGVQRYLTKPLDVGDLLGLLDERIRLSSK